MKQAAIRSSRLVRTALIVLLIVTAQPFQLAVALARPVMVLQGPAALIVNSVGDEPDAAVGDGHCDTDGNTANGDQCTLRAAIDEANPTPANIINFNLAPNSTIILTRSLATTWRAQGVLDQTAREDQAVRAADFPPAVK